MNTMIRNSRCWVKSAFRLIIGCLYRSKTVFSFRILSIVMRYDLGILILLSKILVRTLPWDQWLRRCSKNLPRSGNGCQDANKRVNPSEALADENQVLRFLNKPLLKMKKTLSRLRKFFGPNFSRNDTPKARA